MALLACCRSHLLLEVVSCGRAGRYVVALVRARAAGANEDASRNTSLVLVRAGNAAVTIDRGRLVVTVNRTGVCRLVTFGSVSNGRAINAEAEMYFRANLLSDAVLNDRSCVIAVSRLDVVRSLRSRRYVCLVVTLGIRRILSYAAL